MICKEVKEVIPGFIEGSLSKEMHNEVAEHLQNCKTCTDEMDKLMIIEGAIKNAIDEDVPTIVDQSFTDLLNVEKQKAKVNIYQQLSRKQVPLNQILRIAAGVLLLITGGFIGYLLHPQGDSVKEVASLKQEMSEMKNLMIYSMLKQESASERIKAVSYIKEISQPDPKLIETLFITLNTDRNVNVRLAAAQALSKYKDNKEISKEIVKSLEKQTEPLVQIMLINIAVETRDNEVGPELNKLIQRTDLMDEVKNYAKKGIKTLSI